MERERESIMVNIRQLLWHGWLGHRKSVHPVKSPATNTQRLFLQGIFSEPGLPEVFSRKKNGKHGSKSNKLAGKKLFWIMAVFWKVLFSITSVLRCCCLISMNAIWPSANSIPDSQSHKFFLQDPTLPGMALIRGAGITKTKTSILRSDDGKDELTSCPSSCFFSRRAWPICRTTSPRWGAGIWHQ